MSGRVMRKFRHAGKKAVKFQFAATLERLVVEGTRTWQPHKLSVVWTRRKRRKASTLQSWRPGIENPYKGAVEWSKLNPEIIEIEVTLFKDTRRGQYETKDWVFVLENEAKNGKRKAIATARIDMTEHVSEIPSPRPLHIRFKPLTSKLSMASLALMIKCEFLKEGAATDPDMASVVGSTTSEDTIRLGGVDVCDFTDFDDMEDGGSKRSGSLNSRSSSTKNQILELTQQIEMFSKGFKDEDDETKPDGNLSLSATNSLKSSSRKPSTSGSIAEKSSIGSSKSSKETQDEKKPDEGKKTQNTLTTVVNNDKSNRNSSASESAGSEPSPVQKRRLRPSIDVVPLRQNEALVQHSTPTNYGSPSSELHRPLLRWCQLVTDGYRGVKVTNFTTSWRNGLAFCSVLHRINPGAIAYGDLKPLDGRDNLKKAFLGFRDLGLDADEISKAMRTNSGGIATKAIIISFLTEVKEYFDKHNLDDTIEMLRKEKSELKKSQKSKVPSLSDFRREKLLSDLEEKDGEDDVFSCELEDVLEKETGPDVLHLSIIEDTVELSGETTSQLIQASYMEETTRLSTITESPASPKLVKLGDERTNSFINPAEAKDEELRVVESSEKAIADEINDALSSFSINISEFDSSTPIVKEASFMSSEKTENIAPSTNLATSTAFESDDGACNGASLASNDIAVTVVTREVVVRDELRTDILENNLSPKVEISTSEDNPVTANVKDANDELSIERTLSDVTSLIDSMQKENALISSIAPQDEIGQQMSYSAEDIPSQPVAEEKPISEKRAKALALIEQFKEQSQGKNEDWKTMSLSRDFGSRDGKRREEVRERARKLIEQTRVSLDIKPSAYTRSSECLQHDAQPNGVLSDRSDKYSTLPGKSRIESRVIPQTDSNVEVSQGSFELEIDEVDYGKKKATTNLPEQDASVKLHPGEDSTVSSSIHLPDESLVAEDVSTSPTQEITIETKSFEQSVVREVMREETRVPRLKLAPVSPTKIASFSEFSKISNQSQKNEPSEREHKEEVVSVNKLHDSGDDPLGVSLRYDAPMAVSLNPADYNGNAVKDQDSRYFMVSSKENLAVTPIKLQQDPAGDKKFSPAEDSFIKKQISEKDVEERADSNPFLSEPDTEREPEISIQKAKDFSNTVEISMAEFENSVSILTLDSSPDNKRDAHSLTSAFVNEKTPISVVAENVVIAKSQPSNTCDETSIIQLPEEAKSRDVARVVPKDLDVPVARVEDISTQNKAHKKDVPSPTSRANPLTATPLRAEPSEKILNEPITSTPLAEQGPVKYRHPRLPVKTNGATPAQPGSPIRVTAVKMTALESFSPIMGSPKEDVTDSTRSRPSSIKASRRKSSTSSIRKSIAANDTNPLEQEKLALEEEMRMVDDRSSEVQEELQALKNAGRGKSKQREEILMQEWFQLVQKKNAIVRQQDQLVLLEQEHDLGLQVNEINEQLRPYMSIEESQKTEAQKEAENALIDQLVCLVNERDRIIRTIDENEQTALEDDMHVQTNLDQNMSTVFNQDQEKCAIM